MVLVFFPSVVNEEAKAIIIFVHGDSVQEAGCCVHFCLLMSGGTCAAGEDGRRPPLLYTEALLLLYVVKDQTVLTFHLTIFSL